MCADGSLGVARLIMREREMVPAERVTIVDANCLLECLAPTLTDSPFDKRMSSCAYKL